MRGKMRGVTLPSLPATGHVQAPEGYVYLPVRTDLVDATLAFLAEHGDVSDDEASRGSHATRYGKPGVTWTQEQWASLYELHTTSARRIDKILQVLAGRGPGEANRISLSALAHRSDLTANEVRSAFSKLTQHMLARPEVYPGDAAGRWPFAWAYGREIDPERPREYHYWFGIEQHQSWMRANVAADCSR